MRDIAICGVVLLALCDPLHAGGLERSDQSVGILFEKGRHLVFGITSVSPKLNGVASSRTPTPGQASGDIGVSYRNTRFAFKDDISMAMSYAVIYDEPYGSDIAYPTSTYFASNARAELTSSALTGVLQYRLSQPGAAFGGQISILGGARSQTVNASASVPFVARYSVTASEETSAGYLAGVAWERPELGMRASLVYNSRIKATLDTQESIGGGAPVATRTDLNTPESINLELQTGLTPKTLLFGSIRWVPWSKFTVAPPVYACTTGGPLAFFKDDRTTYRIGLAQRFTDKLVFFGEFGYERSTGSGTTNLTPVDGFKSYSLGATYQIDQVRLTVAARHANAGDAGTILGPIQPAGQFSGNSVRGINFRVAFDLN